MHKPTTLRDVVRQAIVLAYKEDVDLLVAALGEEHLAPSVQRIVYTSEELEFARNSRTFLNHRQAWKKAAQADGYTLICESDFVPCRGMGDFPVFWPIAKATAWGYLYQGSPRLLALLGKRPTYLRAHTAPLVAYVVNAPVARILLEYFDHTAAKLDLRSYFAFDAYLQWFATGKGAAAYMPTRHYGEHGGLPNKEHAAIGKLRYQGEHHADNLMGRLHFLPQYAVGSQAKFLFVRLRSRLLGVARLLSGNWISPNNVYAFSFLDIGRMYLVGASRLGPRILKSGP
jgi:hypothetical protein